MPPKFSVRWFLATLLLVTLWANGTGGSDTEKNGFCEEICDKHRPGNQAFTYHCTESKDYCMSYCKSCPTEVCNPANSRIEFNCPSKLLTVFIILKCAVLLFFLIMIFGMICFIVSLRKRRWQGPIIYVIDAHDSVAGIHYATEIPIEHIDTYRRVDK